VSKYDKERQRKWYLKNREKRLAQCKKYISENKEKVKEVHKKYYQENKEGISKQHAEYRNQKKFGMSVQQREELFSNGCTICGSARRGTGGLCIDHDHETGEVRGCLCHSCNTALGHMKESPSLILKLYRYAVNTCGRSLEKENG
jgi:hypothetical protein